MKITSSHIKDTCEVIAFIAGLTDIALDAKTDHDVIDITSCPAVLNTLPTVTPNFKVALEVRENLSTLETSSHDVLCEKVQDKFAGVTKAAAPKLLSSILDLAHAAHAIYTHQLTGADPVIKTVAATGKETTPVKGKSSAPVK